MTAASTSTAKEAGKLVDKWGTTLIKAGWVALPTTIIKYQKVLGLSPVDLNIILALLAYWWEPENLPRPSKTTLAASINVTPRTVQRHVTALVDKGYLARTPRGPGSTNFYGFGGLIKAARELAEKDVAERAKRKRVDLKKLVGTPARTPSSPVVTPVAEALVAA